MAWVKLRTAVPNLARTGPEVFVVVNDPSMNGTLLCGLMKVILSRKYFKVVITDNAGWVEVSVNIMEHGPSGINIMHYTRRC